MWLSLILFILLLWSWGFEPYLLHFRREKIFSAKINKPVRLLFLSDFHASTNWQLKRQIKKIQKIKKQLKASPSQAVLLGGDYLDTSMNSLADFSCLLTEIKKLNLPIYAVLGNHDHSSCTKKINELVVLMQELGVEVLINREVLLGEISLVGLDDLNQEYEYFPEEPIKFREDYIKRAKAIKWNQGFEQSHCDDFRLLLSHNPDGVYVSDSKIRPADLVLAGHTHGGQFFFLDWFGEILSKIFPHTMPMGSFRTFAGRTKVGDSEVIVTKGFGCSAIPFRLFRPPEAVIVEILPHANI